MFGRSVDSKFGPCGNVAARAHSCGLGRQALLAVQAIWLVALSRAAPHTRARAAFSPCEIALVDRVARNAQGTITLADALAKLASIGDPARRRGASPHPFAVARGLAHLADIEISRAFRAAKYGGRS
ncbi:MAG: hypothetical protein ACK5JM_15360 [Rhodoblastus sp.]